MMMYFNFIICICLILIRQYLFLAKVDCKWGPYGEWSACTKSCGGGFQTRLRDVEQQAFNGGKQCEGESTDLRVCNEHECPGKAYNYHIVWVSTKK